MSERRKSLSGRDTPPPPILTRMQTPAVSHVTSGTQHSRQPTVAGKPRTTSTGRHSPDITSGVGSQPPFSSNGSWSNSDTDEEELMDVHESVGATSSTHHSSKVSTSSDTASGDNVIANKDSTNASGKDEVFVWTHERRAILYRIMIEKGFSPIGPLRYFTMIVVHRAFCEAMSVDIHSDVIWAHLDEIYDMKGLEAWDRAQRLEANLAAVSTEPVEYYTLPAYIQEWAEAKKSNIKTLSSETTALSTEEKNLSENVAEAEDA